MPVGDAGREPAFLLPPAAAGPGALQGRTISAERDLTKIDRNGHVHPHRLSVRLGLLPTFATLLRNAIKYRSYPSVHP
jgi:hypothetical protein